jgi:hypothetical protein
MSDTALPARRSGTPIKITLYNPEDGEITAEFVQTFIPWRMLKRAVALSKLDSENMTEADIDGITNLVVDTFGKRFDAEQLMDGADMGDMLTVIQQIVAKASKANPILPG